MTKNKIAFAGFMGAILVSVGAANAATTSVATKGYVDQQVKSVETTINNLGDKYVTMEQVADAIEDVDLSGYQTIANLSDTINGLDETARKTKYPSVQAVIDGIETLVGLDAAQVADLKKLLGEDGVATQIAELKTAVTSDDATKDGTVAKRIADALKDYTPSEDLPTYQAKSTADLQIGTTGGVFRDMTPAEKAALASGIDADKVAAYEALAGDDGTVAALQTAVNGLNGENGTVTTLVKTVGNEDSGLVQAVATNTANISTLSGSPVFKPADCDNEACVLMVKGENVFWTPVTQPVDDPAETTDGE